MKDASVKRWSRVHTILYRLTGGMIGRRLVDNDMLLLTTTGRKSGENHTVPLLYLRDGDRFVIIASYGGRDRHPDWYLNLVENREAIVQTPEAKDEVVARTADTEERARVWPKITEAHAGYRVYQNRTERQIPVVFLERRPR